jgi:hypothetical protein
MIYVVFPWREEKRELEWTHSLVVNGKKYLHIMWVYVRVKNDLGSVWL